MKGWCLCLDGACGDEGGGLLPHHCMYYLGGGERRVGVSGNGRGVHDSGYGYVSSFLFVLGFFILFEGRVRLVMVIMVVVHEYDSFFFDSSLSTCLSYTPFSEAWNEV